MLQIHTLRDNPVWVKDKLLFRNFKDVHLVDQILEADDRRRIIQIDVERMQANINEASKQIGVLVGSKRLVEAEVLKTVVTSTKEDLSHAIDEIRGLNSEIHRWMVLLPNLPDITVNYGTGAEENDVIEYSSLNPLGIQPGLRPHWELIEDYELVSFELGSKITGRGFPVYIGQGARLQRALTQYFLDFNVDAGYTEYIPPFMVNEASAFATGQLPDKDGQMYHATEDNLFLIPTAEVPVTNLYRDTLLKEWELPIKMTAHSPCFRREAGSFGKEVRGLNRVHQFEKVEIIQIVHFEKSEAALNEMVQHVKNLLESLELPYRILRLCSGDMGFTSAITYDFEVWSAGQERWLEVSSVSNFKTFQTNRMKCRFKDKDGKSQLPHSLNGSSLALPRIFAALIELNQTEVGIRIPEKLRPYFGKDLIVK
jgi:seryl-tRNA synthetase